MNVRNDVNKVLETYRADGKIGSALDAEIILHAGGGNYDVLCKLKDELRFLLIVSDAKVINNNSAVEIQIEIKVSTNQKCARCWQRREDVGVDKTHPELCGRCVTNVTTADGEKRWFA